ncbi:MAG: non-ribosomal peptide synthetase, partial [Gordonia sp. (in: high G+C Gram-positive bacteria)]
MTKERGRDSESSNAPEVLPLTAAQRSMWFAEQLSSDYSVNIAQYLDMRHAPGGLDFELLVECLKDMARATEAPYLRLVEVDGEPRQVVDPQLPYEATIIDFRSADDPVAEAIACMREEYQRPLDMYADDLVATMLLKVADDRTFWYMRAHHIAVDGYAALTSVRMAAERYNAARRGTELHERPFAKLSELVADDEKYQSSSRRSADGEHWASRMADLPARATLSRLGSIARPDPVNLVASGRMDPADQTRIDELCRELGTSAAAVLTAAFSAFMSQMTAHDDIVLTLPVTGRASARIKNAGGMLANVLPVRVLGIAEGTVRNLIGKVGVEMLGALRHQRYRSDDILRDAGLHHSGSATFGPIVNMVFFDKPIEIDGATADYHILSSGMLEDTLLNLYQAQPGAPLVVDLHGNPGLYTSDEIVRHHRRFMRFVTEFIADLDRPVWDVALLGVGERRALLAAGVGAPLVWPTATVADALGMAMGAVPRAVAVIAPDRVLSYGELSARSNALARELIAAGVGPESAVAICFERGPA